MARTDSYWETDDTGSYIKTISPTGYNVLINGSNKYLNFNTVVGTAGYGIRDNNGVMEFKSSGGAWVAFAGAGSSVAGVTGSSPIIVNNTDPANPIITIQQANISQGGYLTSTDWNTFNNKESTSNKATDFSTVNNTLYPSVQAVKTYADGLVVGLLDYRGAYDASVNTFPASGGSGTAGAVLKGDLWIISVAGTLGGTPVQIGDSVVANIDTPGQTAGNWNVLNGNISYVPEDVANKVTSISGASTNTQYPSAKLLFDQLALKQATITPAALTKADDTNVTLTLGGTPATALLQAASLSLGWTGQLSMARGGTGANLVDPNANKLLGWDDTDNSLGFWVIGSGLSYDHSTHTLSASGGGGGTVTSVASADGSITVANPTTTVDLSVVKAPKLTTARTIGGVSFDGTANITVASATGGFAVSGGDLTMGTNKITGLGDPTNAQDAATKNYVDSIAQGLSVKTSVLVATAAALPTNTYLLGVITITATGTLTVDGVVTALNDRILVKNEASQLKNGIYKVTTAGAIGVAAVLTRSTDMDVAAEFPGAFVFVESGTVNVAAGFVCTNSTPPTVGTTAITFTQFSGAGEITAGNGLSKSGNTLTIDTSITVDKTTAQTLTNKTLTTPIIASLYQDAGATKLLTLPAATDTLVGKATTDTFTNKTMTASSNVLGGVTMTLGSDADGDIYYRSSSVLTRLPKGTTLQQLRMNAGATAPEWFTASAGSGDVVGPGSATDTAIARFNTTTGKLIQNSVLTLSGISSQVVTLTTPSNASPTSLLIKGGDDSSSSSIDAGGVTIKGGVANAVGNGGVVKLQSSDGGATSGPGGNVQIIAGNGIGTNAIGGDVQFFSGAKTGSGTAGKYTFIPGSGASNGVLSFDSLSGGTKTFAFPNQSGTIALAISTAGVGVGPAAGGPTTTVTHSLGRTPTTITITGLGRFSSNSSAAIFSTSFGSWNSSGNTVVYMPVTASPAATTTPLFSTSFAIYLSDGGNNNTATGVIQNVTPTSFDIVWTNGGSAGSIAATTVFQWKAE